MNSELNIFWFRRDLRLEDNAGFYRALKSDVAVLPIFIFDTNILDKLDNKKDARVNFIYDTITRLKNSLIAMGSDLNVYYGDPHTIWTQIFKIYKVKSIYYNKDYELYAKNRDEQIRQLALANTVDMFGYKDHVIFEGDEVLKDDHTPYTVFTPYKKKWLQKLNQRGEGIKSFYLKSYPSEKYLPRLLKVTEPSPMISLQAMGFEKSEIEIPPNTIAQNKIIEYGSKRNFPAIDGTSKLGIHFRFGTISIRDKARKAYVLSDIYLSELIWRDFYSMILSHFPHIESHAFRKAYDNINWRNNKEEFHAWCEGKTGYPIVDAGMRELKNSGHMHNRVRMITASFLTKHLLIDWRWGEAWFAAHLLDFDLASNNGGWQWAAGSGTDAAPYFRIFSPDAQTEKFDKYKEYIKKWIPELGTKSYPKPIVDHAYARQRCLEVYKNALNN